VKKETINSIISLFIIIILFIFLSFYIPTNLSIFIRLIGSSVLGMTIYVLLLIVESVIAPISGVPLVPLASNLWGWKIAGFLTVIGWLIGAIFCFLIARRFGVPIVKRLVPIEKLNKLEKHSNNYNLFWGIVFLRIAIPSDILSYAIGLFSNIDLKKYSVATLIGFAPLAFIVAYAGTMPIVYQIILLIIAIVLIIIGVFIAKRYKKNKNRI